MTMGTIFQATVSKRSPVWLPEPPAPVCSRWPGGIWAPTPQQGHWPRVYFGVSMVVGRVGWGGVGWGGGDLGSVEWGKVKKGGVEWNVLESGAVELGCSGLRWGLHLTPLHSIPAHPSPPH